MNPLFAREVHTRWRSARSYLLLLGLVFVLSCYFGWLYWTRLDFYDRVTQYYAPMGLPLSPVVDLSSPSGRLADLGRLLFGSLTECGSLLWLVLGAVLAAPTVAAERESGILQELWLSQLSPREMLWGRFNALVSLLFILQLAALPLTALSFLYGGVSPLEFVLALAIQATAALCGVAIGLWSSTRARRPAEAVSMACGFMVLWACLSEALFTSISGPAALSFDRVLAAGAISFPYRTANALLGDFSRPMPMDMTWVLPALTVQVLFGALLLWKAMQKMMQPLPDSKWRRGNPALVEWREAARERAQAREVAQREQRAKHRTAEGVLLQEYPLSQYLHFKNPLLEREVRSRFRVSHDTAGSAVGRLLGLVAGGLFWVFSCYIALSPGETGNFTPFVAIFAGLGGGLGIVLQSASAFTRDRENGTWEGLRLTAITNAEIATAKWAAPQIGVLYFYWPLLAILPLVANHAATGNLIGTHLSWASGALCILTILSTWWALSAMGCWVSLRCKSTAVATAWTVAAVFLFQGVSSVILTTDGARQLFLPIFESGIWESDSAVGADSPVARRLNAAKDMATACFESPVGALVIYDLTARPDMEILAKDYTYDFYGAGPSSEAQLPRLFTLRVWLTLLNLLWNAGFTLTFLSLIRRRLESEFSGTRKEAMPAPRSGLWVRTRPLTDDKTPWKSTRS